MSYLIIGTFLLQGHHKGIFWSMSFTYINGDLTWKNANLPKAHQNALQILKESYAYTGPYYLYNKEILKSRTQNLIQALPGHHFFYSVKSLSNINLLREIGKHENFGLDVVSAGEITRGKTAGFTGERMVFAGVGKTPSEISYALQNNIRSFHVESFSELNTIAQIAEEQHKKAGVALRLNPNVEVDTHKYITTGKEENKFGLSLNEFEKCIPFLRENRNIELKGLQAHIGSQILDITPYEKTLIFLLEAVKDIELATGTKLQYISLGGGFGIDYTNWENANENDFNLKKLSEILQKNKVSPMEIHFEPGRYISAKTGILVTTVQYIKERTGARIAITDSGMSELIRPALYEAYHPILPLKKKSDTKQIYDIVGPICETADAFALERELYLTEEKDSLAILYAGAYGSVMSSNYNTRPLVPEMLVDGDNLTIIRKPQTVNEILKNELDL